MSSATIQSTIDAAASGSTFVASAGTYTCTATINFTTKDPTLVLLSGAIWAGGDGSFKAIDMGSGGTVRGGEFRHFGNVGSGVKMGAITLREGSIVEDVWAHDNYESGVWVLNAISDATTPGATVRYCLLDSNGRYGIVQLPDGGEGQTQGCHVSYCEISNNNTRHNDPGWDAGSMKFLGSHGGTFDHNWVHDNYGFGPWWDWENSSWTIEENVSETHLQGGLFYESSWGGTIIRRNYFANNGGIATGNASRSFAQIYLADDDGTKGPGTGIDVHNNWTDGIANAIDILEYSTATALGKECKHIHFYDNDVWIRNGGSPDSLNQVGATSSAAPWALWDAARNITWATNHYHVVSAGVGHWTWGGTYGTNRTFAAWKALGLDTAGTEVVIV
jgi:hypothetical protein